MAITSGFFDAQLVNGEYDRTYNSSDFGSMFDGILNDGIFTSIGDKFKVNPSSGFTINVGTGKAWFMGTWINNSAILPLTLSGPPSPQSRIDAIVIDIDKRNQTRANTIKVVTGTPSSSPSRPALANEGNHKQYPLAYITVTNGATSISASKIQDTRGTSACPFISLAEPSITADQLLSQLYARGEEMINEGAATFQVIYAEMEAAIEAASALTILDNSVSTAKVQNGAVTREKLNTDALYSPEVYTSDTGSYTVSASDVGKTLNNTWNKNMAFSIPSENLADIPVGAEFAFLRWGTSDSVVVTFENTQNMYVSDATSPCHKVEISSNFGMIAVKRISATGWLVTGSVEVIE